MLLALGVVGGSIPFVLFFEGLARSGPADAAFIQKTLFVWVAILALPLLHERIGRWQVAGLGMLLVAQLLIGRPTNWSLGSGEWLILAATLFWAVETIVARKLLPEVGVGLGLTARMGLGGLVLLGHLLIQGKMGTLVSLDAEQWRWVLGTSAILLVYVGSWYSALQRAPAVVVTSVLALGAPITVFLATWAGRASPNGVQLSGYLLLIAALAVMTLASWRRGRSLGLVSS
jgi:drug/metabolite transporter (DMT)-like permease